MGSAYHAEFAEGSEVLIASRADLEEFQRTWEFHNKLADQQLDYAGIRARVASVGFYHGGDVLYWLEGVPGVWHESCLTAAS